MGDDDPPGQYTELLPQGTPATLPEGQKYPEADKETGESSGSKRLPHTPRDAWVQWTRTQQAKRAGRLR